MIHFYSELTCGRIYDFTHNFLSRLLGGTLQRLTCMHTSSFVVLNLISICKRHTKAGLFAKPFHVQSKGSTTFVRLMVVASCRRLNTEMILLQRHGLYRILL